MNNEQLHNLAKIVYTHCGINYFTNMTSLKLKITRRLNQLKLDNVELYIEYLDTHSEEWHRLVELLTINETYFYREEKQLLAYIGSVVPHLKTKSNDTIKIWSAGCSSGEEAYSLAIMAYESGYSHADISIMATDINQKVLEIAAKGEYNKSSLSFRRIPNKWLDNYFDDLNMTYKTKRIIQQYVSFSQFNLLDISNVTYKYDIIFCRNVLIYFDDITIQKIIKGFHKCLRPGGYLFLGHTETIAKDVEGFKLIHSEGTFYYRKET